MKLLLTSAGFTTPEIINQAAKLCAKPKEKINIGTINEAYTVEKGDKRWLINDLGRLATAFGGEIDCVNLLALSAEQQLSRLEKADMIFVTGGDTDYLMRVFQKTNFSKLLPELLQTKVYVGSSAGSMVLGKRVSTAEFGQVYEQSPIYGVDEYLELVDFSIAPHLDPTSNDKNQDAILRSSRGYKNVVYGLQDNQAIAVDNGNLFFVGGQPLKVLGGKMIP